MPSLTERRIAALEQNRNQRDVPRLAIMALPLSAEGEVRAIEHRRRGTVVVLMNEDDMRL